MKKSTLKTVPALLAATALAGCMAAQDDRLEGISLTGGNAIAHNSALQIIDPWPENVQDNTLETPAERGAGKQAAALPAQPGQPVAAQ